MGVRPVILERDDQLPGLLRSRRLALDLTQADLDERIGWAERYCSKVEAPDRDYGKRVICGPAGSMFDWLEALGMSLVLMPAADAAALVEAAEGDAIAEAAPQPYPGRERDRALVRETVLTQRIRFRVAA